jgi:hypothetical protein
MGLVVGAIGANARLDHPFSLLASRLLYDLLPDVESCVEGTPPSDTGQHKVPGELADDQADVPNM